MTVYLTIWRYSNKKSSMEFDLFSLTGQCVYNLDILKNVHRLFMYRYSIIIGNLAVIDLINIIDIANFIEL